MRFWIWSVNMTILKAAFFNNSVFSKSFSQNACYHCSSFFLTSSYHWQTFNCLKPLFFTILCMDVRLIPVFHQYCEGTCGFEGYLLQNKISSSTRSTFSFVYTDYLWSSWTSEFSEQILLAFQEHHFVQKNL